MTQALIRPPSNLQQQRCHSHVTPPKTLQPFDGLRHESLTHPLPRTHVLTHWIEEGFFKRNNNHIVMCATVLVSDTIKDGELSGRHNEAV